jgi:2'-5' RNA ligase
VFFCVPKRLFIAVDIDAATREQIGAISAAIRAAVDARASWVRPDRMHLTLQFFAAADDALEDRINGALTEPLRARSFDIAFDGCGLFPERGSPRVLWLGIGAGLADIQRVQREVQDRLHLPAERGVFVPHLTLARFRDRVPRGRVAGMGDIPARAGPSRIDRVTLYESHLSPAGPAYLRLRETPLQP